MMNSNTSVGTWGMVYRSSCTVLPHRAIPPHTYQLDFTAVHSLYYTILYYTIQYKLYYTPSRPLTPLRQTTSPSGTFISTFPQSWAEQSKPMIFESRQLTYSTHKCYDTHTIIHILPHNAMANGIASAKHICSAGEIFGWENINDLISYTNIHYTLCTIYYTYYVHTIHNI